LLSGFIIGLIGIGLFIVRYFRKKKMEKKLWFIQKLVKLMKLHN
jgi:hypothetical protein